MISILAGLILLCGAQALPLDGRIVNGTDAIVGEIPYIVSLKYDLRHTCGGSILNEYWILTAAHCVAGRNSDPSRFSVQYGVTRITSDGIDTIPAELVILNADYVAGNGYVNDVAVIKLTQPLPLSSTVQPVVLPPAYNATPGGADAVLAGWGLPFTGGSVMENLQRVDILIYTDEECEAIHAQTGPTSRSYHVCAGVPEGGRGQCNGDSGGPLTVGGVQVGVVSWSVKPCTLRGYPGVFAKVANYIDWINAQIAANP